MGSESVYVSQCVKRRMECPTENRELRTENWILTAGKASTVARIRGLKLAFCISPTVLFMEMQEQLTKSWFRRKVENTLRRSFMRAYKTVRIDPQRFLLQLRAAYGLPISSYHGVYSIEIARLDDVANRIVRSGMKVAATEGAGFGLGGLLTMVPDLGILSAITLRTIQKLSLLYGFEFNTDEESAELWVAAASAAGVDISRELIEKEVVNKFVPKVIQRIAASASAEVVEKWAGRMIPIASSAIGAGLNYYFVRAWGRRAQDHFRKRHLEVRRRLEAERALPAAEPARLQS